MHEGDEEKKTPEITIQQLLVVVVIAITPLLFGLAPCARFVEEFPIGKTITTVRFIGSKVTERIYQYEYLIQTILNHFTDLGIRNPIEAYIFIPMGILFGVFIGSFSLLAMDIGNKHRMGIRKNVTKLSTYRALTSIALIGNVIGVTGILTFRNIIVDLIEIYPGLHFSYAFYHIFILFFISLAFSIFRVIYPNREFKYQKREKPVEEKKEVKQTFEEVRKKLRIIIIIIATMFVLWCLQTVLIIVFFDRITLEVVFGVFIGLTVIFLGPLGYLVPVGLKLRKQITELNKEIPTKTEKN